MTKDNLRERILADWPAKVLSLAAAVVLYFFSSIFGMTEHKVMVSITYLLPQGLVPAREMTSHVNLVFRGDARHIDSLKAMKFQGEDFLVSADFESVSQAGEHTANVLVRAQRPGLELASLGFERVEPSRVTIVLEPVAYRDLPVDPDVSGSPAKGYELVSLQVQPRTLRVEGPAGRLATLGALRTENVDLGDRDQSFAQKYRVLSPDPLVRVHPVERVLVLVDIQGTQDTVVYGEVKIEVINLRQEFQTSPVTVHGLVRLRQLRSAQERVETGQRIPRLLVDCSGVNAPGTYNLSVRTDLPSGTELVEAVPRALTLVITAVPVVEEETP